MEQCAQIISAVENSSLTHNQLQVWTAQKLLDDQPIYNLPVALTISGKIELHRFRKAFQVLVNSSDALRMVIEETGGFPSWRVIPELTFDMPILDFRNRSNPNAAAMQWMQLQSVLPFDMQSRLFDSALLQLSADNVVFYLNTHHLISDAWSVQLIYQRLAQLYEFSVAQDFPEKFPLISFADFEASQRQQKNLVRHNRAKAYWKQKLCVESELVRFYGVANTKTGARVRLIICDLGSERSKKLRQAMRLMSDKKSSEDLLLLNAIYAVLCVYLARIHNNRNCFVGMVSHNRRSKLSKETIGLFSEVLPVHVSVGEDDNFCTLMRRVESEIFDTLRHGNFAVANPVYHQVYDVVLNYHKAAFNDFCGMPARPEWIHTGYGFESLVLQIYDFSSTGALTVGFDFHEDVFSSEQAELATDHFLVVLDAMLADPVRPIDDLELVSADDRRLLLPNWNDTVTTDFGEEGVIRLFEQQVQKAPDATAAVFDEKTITYAELNRRANQLARRLKKSGIGPNIPVGICIERSLEMVVGLLAILKAGGAYVPIDPTSPRDRLKAILEDTELPLLLTQQALLESVPFPEVQIICLDLDWKQISEENDQNLDSAILGDHLAYIIYTSGSTGEPKGAEITHRAFFNFCTWATDFYFIKPSDRILQFAAISFDAAIEEIFPCLTGGATLVLRTEQSISSVPIFLQKCCQWKTTVLDLPTSYWHEVTSSLCLKAARLPDSVRLVIIGGESVSRTQLVEWQKTIGNSCRLVNTYGPTEATVVTTACDLTEVAELGALAKPVSIGRPISGARAYVLDRRMNLVPVGVAGELYIGGVGLARGYRNNADLTTEKFVFKAFGSGIKERLYRTGDLVRYRPDGQLEFLARLDRQFKIRGYRVDPGEIENVLSQYPGVHEVFVTYSDLAGDEKRIVAFVIPKQGVNLLASELKAYLIGKLPAHMMPASILFTERFPRSVSGKIDCDALLTSEVMLPLHDVTSTPPRSPIEKELVDIWGEVLGLEQIKIHESFFQLGGHSLSATQVISRIRDRYQIDLPLRSIFDSPTIAGLANQIQLALQTNHGAVGRPLLTPVRRSQELPLSYSQSRMWFMHKFAPQSPAYNLGAALRLKGYLNREALSYSVNEIVRRHEAIRTVFLSVDGQPRQVITDWRPVNVPNIDFRDLPTKLALEKTRQCVVDEVRRPFDLERDLLMRLLLVQVSEDDHVLVVSMHHIASDQWSMGIIARELTHLYSLFCDGSPVHLSPLVLQYADFAVWQRRWIQSEVLQQQLSDWKVRLAGLKTLNLPTDKPRSSEQTFNGAQLTWSLSDSLVSGLKRLSVEQGTTLYMTFLAAFTTLLYRYSGETDIAIGSPIANRNWLAIEGIVGTFVNTLVMRTNLAGNPSFRELLERVRDVTIDAYARQETPFEKLVEELQPQRDASVSPLVQVLFNFQNAPVGNLNLHGLSWSPFEFDIGASQFDLCLAVDPNILNKIILVYNPDLFDQSRMCRMLEHYVRILEAVVATPEEKIDHVNFLCELEETIVGEMSRGEQSDLSAVPCVHEVFEAQVKRTPEAVAIVFEGEKVTYQELNARANQLAHYLISLDVGREDTVAIFIEPSVEMVVSLLGVLKSGAAYVPLDPAYPEKRLSLILEDSGVAVVLTQEKLIKNLPSSNARLVCLDQDSLITICQPAENPKPGISTENLAYLIYTSGSTGRPKGVEIQHRALVNFLTSMAKEPGIEPHDVLLSVTPLSFDICALEILLPLTIGAQVVLLPRHITVDGRLLRDRVHDSGATIMQATPMTWRMLIAAGWKGNDKLKILCGGEALTKDLAGALLARGRSLYNLYGPTETTVWSTVWRVEPDSGTIVIGHPIDNTQIYVLDSHLQLMPLGIEGDLYIGGLGVAKGYRSNPSLTQEKFVHDPFTGNSAMRLFKTGDRARYLPDGSIEYLGRSDFQIKLRGYRIELGEIESVLTEHAAVSQCVVVAKGEPAGQKQLVSYVVPVEKRNVTQEVLQGYLRERLPSYMVPTSFVVLNSLPLTPNGKVDRNALPNPTPQSQDAIHSALPRNRLELGLVKIWQDLLEVRHVGIRDNFFDLGGHSLLAIRLIARIEQLTGKNIPAATLFRAPTVEQLSAILEDENQLQSWSNLVPIQTAGSRKPFFLIHGENSNLFLPDYLGKDQPLFSLEHQSGDGRRASYTQVETIASHYLNEIRTVQSQGPYLLGGYSFGGVIAFEIAQQLRRENQEVGLLALIDTLSIGPPRSNSISLKSLFTDGAIFFLGCVSKLQRWFAKKACLSVHEISVRVLVDSARVFTNIISRKFQEIGNWFKSVVCNTYAKMEHIIPPKLRSTYILSIYAKAAQAYHPYPYPGRTVYIKSQNDSADPRLSWGKLVVGEFKIYDVPGSHLDLREGPFIGAWASILKYELDRMAEKSYTDQSMSLHEQPRQRTVFRLSHASPSPLVSSH